MSGESTTSTSGESSPEISENVPMSNFTLFCNGEGDVMHFILLLRDKNEEEKIHQLIVDHQGAVSTSLKDFRSDSHSIVLVDENALSWNHCGDVFRVSYVQECIRHGIVLDISKFLKDKSHEFIEDFDYMDIVYFKKFSWDSVPREFWLKKNHDSNSESTDGSTNSPQRSLESTPTKRKKPLFPRKSYSRQEKEAILKYVLKNFNSSGNNTLKGRYLWENMERAQICDRTWQSMKEHFLKTMVKELSSYSFLDKKDKERILNALNTRE